MIDKNQNLFNGKKSDLLAKFNVSDKPFEKISYISPPDQILYVCTTDGFIKSITPSVKDKDGKPFDFNDMPLECEVEVN